MIFGKSVNYNLEHVNIYFCKCKCGIRNYNLENLNPLDLNNVFALAMGWGGSEV